MRKSLITLFLATTVYLANASSSRADTVTFQYTAQIATLTGTPIFGINVTLGTTVTGFFSVY